MRSSSTKAKLIAIHQATKDTIFTRTMRMELGFSMDRSITLLSDNIPGMCFIVTTHHKACTRYLAVKRQLTKSYVDEVSLTLEYCFSSCMLVDLLTNAKSRQERRKAIANTSL